jgi:hypothetical protein
MGKTVARTAYMKAALRKPENISVNVSNHVIVTHQRDKVVAAIISGCSVTDLHSSIQGGIVGAKQTTHVMMARQFTP